MNNERKAFEKIVRILNIHSSLEKYTTEQFSGQYVDGAVQLAWTDWQTKASTPHELVATVSMSCEHPAVIAPNGWKLVPIKPIKEMLHALAGIGSELPRAAHSIHMLKRYEAMLSASPQPPNTVEYGQDFNLEYTCKRIRRLLRALDISDPSDDKDSVLMGCLFSLLGRACSKLESPTPPVEVEPIGTVRCRNGEWFGYIPSKVLKDKRVEVGDKLYTSVAIEAATIKVIVDQASSIEFWQKDSAEAWDKCEERRLESAKQDELITQLTQALAVAAAIIYMFTDDNITHAVVGSSEKLKEAAAPILMAIPDTGKDPITYILEALNKAKGDAG